MNVQRYKRIRGTIRELQELTHGSGKADGQDGGDLFRSLLLIWTHLRDDFILGMLKNVIVLD